VGIPGRLNVIIRRSAKLRKKYGIPKNNKVINTIVFGYPTKFPDKSLPRRDSKVDWL
jgi:hypothetical protein